MKILLRKRKTSPNDLIHQMRIRDYISHYRISKVRCNQLIYRWLIHNITSWLFVKNFMVVTNLFWIQWWLLGFKNLNTQIVDLLCMIVPDLSWVNDSEANEAAYEESNCQCQHWWCQGISNKFDYIIGFKTEDASITWKAPRKIFTLTRTNHTYVSKVKMISQCF